MAAIVAVLMLLAVAAPARAATVSMTTQQECLPKSGCWDAHRITFVAGPGEANDVLVTQQGQDVRVADAGAPLTAGAGCRADGERAAVCAIQQQLQLLLVDLGDGDDRGEGAGATLRGGPGNDVLIGGSGDGGPGDDLVRGQFLQRGGEGDDRVELTAAGTAEPGPGRDVVVGSPGDDHITDEDAEPDRVDGGGGSDELSFLTAPAGVTIDLSTGDIAGVERLGGSNHDDVLLGSQAGELLVGRGGRDRVDGRGGADRVVGDAGDDVLLGGEGDDAVIAGHGLDAIDLGPGDDRLDSGDDYQADRVSCGSGADRGRANRGERLEGCESVRRVGVRGLSVWLERAPGGRARMWVQCEYDWPSCRGVARVRGGPALRFAPAGGVRTRARTRRFRARGTLRVTVLLDARRAPGVLPVTRRARVPSRNR